MRLLTAHMSNGTGSDGYVMRNTDILFTQYELMRVH